MPSVLIEARHLVDRLRHQRARADDLRELRRRLAALPGAGEVSDQSLSLARELRELRAELTEALGAVRSCGGCAKGYPEPYGHWSGGHCCGGRTEQVFTNDELAALKLAGTTAGRLRAPRSDLAGCAFRGPAGCSLESRDRPSLCVRYTCRELERELAEDGRFKAIAELQERVRVAFQRFAEERRHAEELAELE